MSLIPAFQIGLWNAWVLILPFALVGYGLSFSIVNKKAGLRLSPRYDEKEKALMITVMAGEFASYAYTIFLPLKLGTAWFYVGFPIYLASMVFVTIVVVSFATSPVDKPVTKGIYRISRNPTYFGCFLIYISIGIACSSWVFLLMAMGYIALLNILVAPEERMCLEKYGEAYRDYMKRTPKWIGIPKSPGK
jgi:steroid 5-alpha reductase family enzyme